MKIFVSLILLVLFAGCKGTSTEGEKEARRHVQSVAGSYRPEGRKPELPVLTTKSSLSAFLTSSRRCSFGLWSFGQCQCLKGFTTTPTKMRTCSSFGWAILVSRPRSCLLRPSDGSVSDRATLIE